MAPAGARILTCDGLPIRELIKRNVFAFGGRVAEAGQWWVMAPRVLQDTHNPFVKLPSRCVFATTHGHETRTLTWSVPTEESFDALKNPPPVDDPQPIGLTERNNGIFWIAMPTFQPDAAGRAAYDQLNKDVEAKRPQILQARAVVFD